MTEYALSRLGNRLRPQEEAARQRCGAQAAGHRGRAGALACAAVVFALEAGAGPALAAHPKPPPEPAAHATPSGLPVPRYASLKFGEVNARGGPGDDYKLLWTYRIRGLPLQVIAESAEWRRVCDPEGAVAWVHQRTLDARRTVMRTQEDGLPVRRNPKADSPTVAVLAGRSLAHFESCRNGWCRISAGKARGWIPAATVWGTADTPQCRLPFARPAG